MIKLLRDYGVLFFNFLFIFNLLFVKIFELKGLNCLIICAQFVIVESNMFCSKQKLYKTPLISKLGCFLEVLSTGRDIMIGKKRWKNMRLVC